jgi:hypothetical protein
VAEKGAPFTVFPPRIPSKPINSIGPPKGGGPSGLCLCACTAAALNTSIPLKTKHIFIFEFIFTFSSSLLRRDGLLTAAISF